MSTRKSWDQYTSQKKVIETEEILKEFKNNFHVLEIQMFLFGQNTCQEHRHFYYYNIKTPSWICS